jgi:hypothetical protein
VRATAGAAFKAGVVGGLGLVVVLLIGLIPIPLRICMVGFGFVVVWIGAGMLAGVLGEDKIESRRQAVGSGALAGFVAAIVGGIGAMALAALGTMFPELGEGVLAQFSPAQLESLAQQGIDSDLIRLAGSTLAALLACGIGGVIPSMAMASLGGRLYFRLRH